MDVLRKPGDLLVQPPWLVVHALQSPPPLLLTTQLDLGEAAVIALAVERSIRLVAIDERRGRMVARALGLEVTGSLGVLLRAKKVGLITAIRPCLDAMSDAGMWIGHRLKADVLREAGEG